MNRLLATIAGLSLAVACTSQPSHPESGSDAAGANANGAATAPSTAAQQPASPTPLPFGPEADVQRWTTDKFMLAGGEEKYLCFAKTLDEDITINGLATAGERYVHHMLFARTAIPEPEGFQDCGVAFKQSWDPMFVSGAGANKLEFPDDAGNLLTKGTQLLLQLHLLNAADAPLEASTAIYLRKSKVMNPRPVSSYTFGTAGIRLAPKRKTTVTGTCAMLQSVTLIGGFGHMHTLGSSIQLEAGDAETNMRVLLKRDPYSFDAQSIDKLDVTINPGDIVRVSCTYDNTTDNVVRYGESTTSEMCYVVGFAIDQPFQGGCLEEYPSDAFTL